jgi:hypothetical protein
MASEEQVKEWKEKYGKIMKMKVGGVEYIYRALLLPEYLNIQKITEADDSVQPEIETVKAGVLEPKLPENPPAGVVMLISDEILKLSGFNQEGPPEEL